MLKFVKYSNSEALEFGMTSENCVCRAAAIVKQFPYKYIRFIAQNIIEKHPSSKNTPETGLSKENCGKLFHLLGGKYHKKRIPRPNKEKLKANLPVDKKLIVLTHRHASAIINSNIIDTYDWTNLEIHHLDDGIQARDISYDVIGYWLFS